MFTRLLAFKNWVKSQINHKRKKSRIQSYLDNGKNPWSLGYLEYRDDQIEKTLGNLPEYFNNWYPRLDERVVELPWVFKNLPPNVKRMLDAGSSLNHEYVLKQNIFKNIELTICTYYPEPYSKLDQRISYVFADLRELPFKDKWFDAIACVSTIEHIEMDNSMYGYESKVVAKEKAYTYLNAINEMVRVLNDGGKLLLTFPFGKFENHGFFQQFDEDMVMRMLAFLNAKGTSTVAYFKYSSDGWNQSVLEECRNMESYNPHTGVGKKEDGAAHSRAICCISFIKLST
jgi:SAM-dependent methyltransferase